MNYFHFKGGSEMRVKVSVCDEFKTRWRSI